ncbi:MAG: hypothetical protein SFU25_00430 [Candidatus Caenarcaniphilales bacterium]|nr:hypothetical protein [Candidatus Caenarcaniphilales bacterium]
MKIKSLNSLRRSKSSQNPLLQTKRAKVLKSSYQNSSWNEPLIEISREHSLRIDLNNFTNEALGKAITELNRQLLEE